MAVKTRPTRDIRDNHINRPGTTYTKPPELWRLKAEEIEAIRGTLIEAAYTVCPKDVFLGGELALSEDRDGFLRFLNLLPGTGPATPVDGDVWITASTILAHAGGITHDLIAGAPAATESIAGVAEIATQAETDAGTDDARFVTPAKLAATTLAFTPSNDSNLVHITLTELITGQKTFQSQVGVGGLPDPSTILDLQSVTSGLALPRMTTAQRTGITAPIDGLVVFDTDTDSIWMRSAGAWVELDSAGGMPGPHAASHQDGGTDEINVGGLSGLLADDQTPLAHDIITKHTASGLTTGHVLTATGATTFGFQAPGTPGLHASTHQDGGADEINVGGLSGELADPQPPKAHAIDGVDHTAAGLTTGHVLTATSATTFGFAAVDESLVVETTAINRVLVAADEAKVIRTTAASIDITLPDPFVVGSGWNVHIKEGNDSTGTRILRHDSEQIDTVAGDVTLAKLESRWLVTDGTNWWSI